MKKTYIQPALEILPVGTIVALCVSREVMEGLNGDNNGANPWTGSRAPRRTSVF